MAHITAWHPDDRAFWEREGGRIALRNLALSVPALVLAFAVWTLWSVAVVYLPRAGFRFSSLQLFTLAALPALSGAALRALHAFVLPNAGGRRWTALSTACLLAPTLGFGLAVQDPATGYATFAALALLCGIGGANFASSMVHVAACFPAAQRAFALGLNAGMGNLGVSLAQFAIPLAVTGGVFGALGGAPQGGATGAGPGALWLQNAGLLWVPFISLAAAAAWLGLDDLGDAPSRPAKRAAVTHRRHAWTLCWLYLGTFGTYLGLAAGLPLLLETQFSASHALTYAWIGPLAGALARPVGGWLADEAGGARVSFAAFAGMGVAAAGALLWLPGGQSPGHLGGFVAAAFALFILAGIGNGAVFRLVPAVFAADHGRRVARAGRTEGDADERAAAAEGAAALGMASAAGATGGFFIPVFFGASLALAGTVAPALAAFVAFYATCAGATWRAFLREKVSVA
jgi:NNP family nitrate/nitrite transporter-like MFS transporter